MNFFQLQHDSSFESNVVGCSLTHLTFDRTSVFSFCEKMLLSAGGNVDLVDNTGETALLRAARDGHSQVVEVRSLSLLC